MTSSFGSCTWSFEDHLDGVKIWLDAESPSRTAKDYDEFVTDYNRKLSDGQLALHGSTSIRRKLNIKWNAVIGLVSGRGGGYEAKRREELRDLVKTGSRLQLVGSKAVALLKRCNRSAIAPYIDSEGFPVPVAEVGGRRAWYYEDLVLWAQSRETPRREPGEIQEQIVESDEIARRRGITTASVRSAIHERQWKYVPEPAGKVGRSHYWLRADVESWFSNRSEAARSSTH